MTAKIHRMPAYLADLPPPAAARLETARRAVLDWLFAHDYQLHIPPLAEYVETLDGGDELLRLDIFQMTDTVSGRSLGIRADHTPQIARYDASIAAADANSDSQTDNKYAIYQGDRFAYCGPALRTRPAQPWKLREIMQAGAELFNADSPAADWEIIRLAIGSLQSAGLNDIAIDIGHAGILGALLQAGANKGSKGNNPLSSAALATLCRHASRHDAAVLRAQINPNNPAAADDVLALLSVNGNGEDALHTTKQITQKSGVNVNAMIDDLAFISEQLRGEGFDVAINFAEIGGYGYHTGAVFSIFGGNFIAARGGRYARSGFRTAVGFSMDLREVVEHLSPPSPPPPPVLCPLVDVMDMKDSRTEYKSWLQAIDTLRSSGRRLRFVDAGASLSPPFLQKRGTKWEVCES